MVTVVVVILRLTFFYADGYKSGLFRDLNERYLWSCCLCSSFKGGILLSRSSLAHTANDLAPSNLFKPELCVSLIFCAKVSETYLKYTNLNADPPTTIPPKMVQSLFCSGERCFNILDRCVCVSVCECGCVCIYELYLIL